MTELLIWKLYSDIECVLAAYKDLIHMYILYIYISSIGMILKINEYKYKV